MTGSFSDWRRELRKVGFRSLGTGGRKGTFLGRDVGPFQQTIGVVVAEHRGHAFNVQLNINMALRCAEPPHLVVILVGDLAPEGVRVFEPWVHDPSHATWWRPDQVDASRDALVRFGLDWLDRHADTSTLIRYFEGEYQRHEREQRARESGGWLRWIRERLGMSSEQASAHYEYLLWLSMLHELEGQVDRAQERLEEYAAAIEARGIVAEAHRLERHRSFLADLSGA